MFKMRLGWYAGVSAALAGAVVVSAFHQRANFYSAMVYLAQSNFCLLALVNFSLLLYSSFIYALTRLCFGTLRVVEVEQLTERAWFAITETCLAMTIFREEIGALFLVMFTALVTGKVWGWIGDGRVEFLEQQPPPNPGLFHLRLSTSLALSFLYDIWILRYAVHNVIQQARPNMMVMFLFEFAVLATCSWRTGARYVLVLAEQNIVKAQTKKRLQERRQEVREQREAMIRQRQQAVERGEEIPADSEPLPSEDDVDEMDIEVPGWATKGEWVLWLDLLSDMIKLGIYVAFFFMLLMFYGLPIHIMRDLFMTSRDFFKRLHALLRYRRAIQEMNRYPDATAEDLAQENTCIICREEMRPWDPVANPGVIDRVRPKKLPCGHILHLGCLKSWLERQQVCPTCRSPVTADRPRNRNGAAGIGIQIGGLRRQGQAQGVGDGEAGAGQGRLNGEQEPPGEGGPRIFNLGPIRLGFGGNHQQVRELAQQFGLPQMAARPPAATPAPTSTQNQPTVGDNLQHIGNLIHQSEQIVRREMQHLHMAQQELQIAQLLMTELQRLQQRRQQFQDQVPAGSPQPAGPPPNFALNPPFPHLQATGPGYQPQLPVIPGFPGVPSRSGSPLMARLGAAGSTPAIPAGSAELPEGVSLPPGWSLMPLQRLDSVPNIGQIPAQAGIPPHADAASAGPATQDPTAPVTIGSGASNGQAGEASFSATRTQGSSFSRPVEAAQSIGPAESATMTAPSPVMPGWGDSAQLFNSAPRDGANETDYSPTEAGELQCDAPGDGSAPHAELGHGLGINGRGSLVDEEEQTVEYPSKGKGKAVTIEESRDEE